MEELNFTLGLALEDFLTIIFFAVGLIYLGRMAKKADPFAGRIVYTGGALITLGGLTQAGWKLTVVIAGRNLVWLDNLQFILMMPGFVLLAAGLGAALRRNRTGAIGPRYLFRPAMYIFIALAGAQYLASTQAGRGWFFVLLGVTTIFNVYVSAALVRRAWQRGDRIAAALFFVNILLVFTAAGLARVLGDELSAQWTKQITNNISYLAFAIAAYRIASNSD